MLSLGFYKQERDWADKPMDYNLGWQSREGVLMEIYTNRKTEGLYIWIYIYNSVSFLVDVKLALVDVKIANEKLFKLKYK